MQIPIEEAYRAVDQLKTDYAKAYRNRHDEEQQSKKYFDLGFDGWFESEEHIALLIEHGFDSVEQFEDACERSAYGIANDKIRKMFNVVDSDTRELIYSALKSKDLYNEEDQFLKSITIWNLIKKVAPKYAQLVDLIDELDVRVIFPLT